MTSAFTADSRDRVRDAVDMIAVVSDHTELRRAGATEYVGRCPFHDERTPSFGVNPIDKVYYCFGCQASGDVFTFVMETEGLDFPGALQTLADRFGVELQTEDEDPQAVAAPPAARASAVAARPRRHLLRALPVGGAGSAARTRIPTSPRASRGDAPNLPRRLRAQRVGPDPDRVAPGGLQR